ncbi:MAG: cadherin-like beta sandwich domain-containing protein [Ruminococcaceae bacterium]|nr:cadherin-like beta sandwich domain-containing protein [Oscillospiraceae bacterium]
MNKLSRCFAVLVALVMLLTLAVPMKAEATTVDNGELQAEITLSADSAKIKKTVDITISIKNNTAHEISDLSYKFTFDNNALGIVSYPAIPTKTAFTQTGNVIEVSYQATNRTDCIPIAVGATASVTFTMLVQNNTANGAPIDLTVTDMKAYMRTDVTNTALSAENISHTFTFKPTTQKKLTVTNLSNDAALTNIVPIVNNSEVEMTPAFSPDVTSYYVVVTYSIPDFKFNWTKSDPASAVEYVPPADNTLSVGENTFQFVVTAEDGTTKRTYTAIVRRLALGETLPTSTTTSVTESTTTTTTTTTETTTQPTAAEPTQNEEEEKGEGNFSATVSLTLWTLLGLVFIQIALFILAFFAGYMTHKNATKPADPTLEDMLAAQQQLEMQGYMPQQAEEQPEEVEETQQTEEYDPNAVQYDENGYPMLPSGDYGNGYGNPANAQYGQYDQYGQYGQYYDQQPGYQQPGGYLPSEFGVTETPAPAQPGADEYDEYGYNIYGESNAQQ